MKYTILLDAFSEDIFYKMEEISEGREGHKCEIEAETKDQAVERLLEKLKPFIKEQFS